MSVISENTTILSAGATLVEATGVSGARIRQPPTNDPHSIQNTTGYEVALRD